MSIKKKNKFRILNKKSKFYKLLIHKSIKHIYINIFKPFPYNNIIILSISSLNKNIKNDLSKLNIKNNNILLSKYIGKIVANKCLDINLINKVIVDIGGFKYHGKIKYLIDELKKENIIYNKKYK